MSKKFFNYFYKLDTCLYVILVFCFFGCIRNFILMRYAGFDYSYLLTKVCLAMFAIYFTQCVLILLKQRLVFVASLIQCFFCLFVYKDFTFLPITNLLNIIKNYAFPELSYGEEYFFSFACLSFLFCMEIIKTYLLYVLIPSAKKPKKDKILS